MQMIRWKFYSVVATYCIYREFLYYMIFYLIHHLLEFINKKS